MKKPHGWLRYMVGIPPGGGTFVVDPFTDPDDFGNTIGGPQGVPNTPAQLSLWPLVAAAGGDFGLVTIFPTSITFGPDGGTTDVVLTLTNNSAGALVGFLNVVVPAVSAMAI